jgi:HPr kinase/phosphorylase
MSITVQDFFDAASHELALEFISGEADMGKVIPEASMNRPGLALAGFFQYFAHKRLQVLGLAELTYLKNLPAEERRSRIKMLYDKHIPGVVITRNRHAPPAILELAKEARVPVMRTRMITMDFINAGTVIMEELISPRERFHGTMVDIMGVGVLIQGKPGIGKSETALALIERGHSLVADDVTILHRERSGVVMGSAVDVTRYHMEIRGLGLIHVPSLFGVASMRVKMKLNLIVKLIPQSDDEDIDRTGLTPRTCRVLGEEIPLVTLAVAAGRDSSLLIEAAALNQKLKLLGHDAAKELDDKIIGILSEKAKIHK